MEPIRININVTLDASDNLLGALQALTGSRAQAPTAPETKPAPAKPETKPEPRKPETKEAPAAPEVEDMPEEIANPPKEITDEALRALIKEVRTATSPAAVRGLFNEFGIKTSIECPMERRPELVARLKKLAA